MRSGQDFASGRLHAIKSVCGWVESISRMGPYHVLSATQTIQTTHVWRMRNIGANMLHPTYGYHPAPVCD